MSTILGAPLARRGFETIAIDMPEYGLTQVGDETSLNLFMSRVGVPMAKLTAMTPLAGMRMPMSLASKMHALVNDKAALKACLADKTSAGKWVTMTFLATYADYVPAIEPENFDVCPILLTQPAQDYWTPLHLSELFLERVKRVPVKTVMLDNAGHYPIEQPGLDQMVAAIEAFCSEIARRAV